MLWTINVYIISAILATVRSRPLAWLLPMCDGPVDLLWFMPKAGWMDMSVIPHCEVGQSLERSPGLYCYLTENRLRSTCYCSRLGSLSAFCRTMQEKPELSYVHAPHCAWCCMTECLSLSFCLSLLPFLNKALNGTYITHAYNIFKEYEIAGSADPNIFLLYDRSIGQTVTHLTNQNYFYCLSLHLKTKTT